jgi:uncharacterized membrane protein
MKIIINILTGLVSLAMFASAIGFLIPTSMGLEIVKSFHFPVWSRWIFGIIELLLSLLIIFPKYRIMACVGILLWLIFDAIVHSITEQVEWVILAIFFVPTSILLMLLLKEKTKINLVNK